MNYPLLDDLVGNGIRVWVKQENHLPVSTFKVRNATSALTALVARDPAAAKRGVAAATTGNHGQGLAWAGARLGVPVTICVPEGNNPEKNANIRAYGARLVEHGASYDDAVVRCAQVVAEEGLTLIHSTNNTDVLAGAGTMMAEFVEQVPDLDAVIIALGGGSQCVGAITVRDTMHPALEVYAVQSEAASAQYDAWRDGVPRARQSARSFAEGIATGSTYELTVETLRAGLTDFVLVSEDAIAQGVRDLLQFTHNVAELVPSLAFALFAIPLPLTPVQALSIDMGTDSLTALGLGVERGNPKAMQQAPRPRGAHLLNGAVALRAYLFLGLYEAAAALAAFFFVLHSGGWQYGTDMASSDPLYRQATTACLAAIVLLQIVNVFLCRSAVRSAFTTGFGGNSLILWGVLLEASLIILITYTPWGNLLLDTAPLSVAVWLFLLPWALGMIALEELRKLLARRRLPIPKP